MILFKQNPEILNKGCSKYDGIFYAIGLHYLKHAKDLSDEEVVAKTRVGNRGKKKKPPALRKWLKRRTGIAPVIGHMKNHGRLGRNYLLGVEDGSMNVILCEAGHNIRKLLRAFLIVSFLAAVQNLFSQYVNA